MEFLNQELVATSNIFLPHGLIEISKDAEFAKYSFWGFGVKTRQPMKHFYDYLLEISTLTKKKIKKLRKLTKHENF